MRWRITYAQMKDGISYLAWVFSRNKSGLSRQKPQRNIDTPATVDIIKSGRKKAMNKNNDGYWICSNGKISHFHESETVCKCGCGFNEPNKILVDKMEVLRLNIGKPITVSSWCRCSEHNKRQGGAKGSAHLIGLAVDYYCPLMSLTQLWFFSESHDNQFNGLGSYPEFDVPVIHSDLISRVSRWVFREDKYWYLF